MPYPESSIAKPTPTILSHLHTLLQSHQLAHPHLSLPYLHPYAPSSSASWKGKAREIPLNPSAQLDILRQLRETVEAAKGLLVKTGGKEEERERVKLARALKEVVTHQSSLLHLTSSLSSLPAPRAKHPLLPTPLVLLPPIELLTVLARTLSIQTYLEDSQFGLLKTSLALAGNRFVVDVDLETDAVGNDDDDEDVDIDKRMEGRGRVRLSKLTANHVGPTGATGKSDWVAGVLRGRLEGYLDAWNEGDRGGRLEALIRGLEGELGELKMLDDLVVAMGEGEAPDIFADLEDAASRVLGSPLLFTTEPSSIFPTFRLLDSSLEAPNPAFRLRPSRHGEIAPVPQMRSKDMIVDEKPWLSGSWVLEYVDEASGRASGDTLGGLRVRASWLSQRELEKESAGSWDALVKLEQLIYTQQASMTGHTSSRDSSAFAFPYKSDFVARPTSTKGQAANLSQRWAMAQPGPAGFIAARFGISPTWTDFERLIAALRDQVVLNQLFCSVFRPSLLDQADDQQEDGESEDADSMDEIDDPMGAPAAIPLTLTLQQSTIRVALPLPHSTEDDQIRTLIFVVGTSEAPPSFTRIVSWTLQPVGQLSKEEEEQLRVALEAGGAGGRDLVEMIRRLEQALRT